MSLSIGITPPGLDPASLAFVRDAERVGATSVWVPETWVYDAFTPLGYLAAATETMRLNSRFCFFVSNGLSPAKQLSSVYLLMPPIVRPAANCF